MTIRMLDLPAAPTTKDANRQAEWRHAVRRALLGWRASLEPQAHGRMSDVVRAHFCTFIAERPAATIGLYWPIQNEVDLRPVIAGHLARGGKAALPVVPGRDQPMIFHEWAIDTDMVPGFAGIPEPQGTPVAVPHVMLTPLVGFDPAGYRLGYGGGFFDRTLAAMAKRPLVVGIGFEATCLPDILPHEYDIPVDMLITDAGMRPVSDRAISEKDRVDQFSPPCHLST